MYIPFVIGKYIFKYIIIYLFISMNKNEIAHCLNSYAVTSHFSRTYLIPLITERKEMSGANECYSCLNMPWGIDFIEMRSFI